MMADSKGQTILNAEVGRRKAERRDAALWRLIKE